MTKLDKVITIVVVVAVFGGVFSLRFANEADLAKVYQTPPVDDMPAPTILPILGPIVAVVVVFGIIKLVQGAIQLHKDRKAAKTGDFLLEGAK
jgi:hypothetical protein